MKARGEVPDPVRFAILTGAGPGAIAVARIWGDQAVRLASTVFRPLRGPSLERTPTDRLRVGRVGAGLGDEVVAVIRPGQTREVEIQFHAGIATEDLVTAAFIEVGASRAPIEEWLKRDEPSPWQAAALLDLSRAATVRSASILLDQSQGALVHTVKQIVAEIDSNRPHALELLGVLKRRATVGMRLLTGWTIAIAGRPNVGKSRLLNALAGYERAIVSPIPGTTRDALTIQTALDGWPVEIVDTAGLRETNDPIEAAGVALARSRQERADLVLVVLDRSEPLTVADRRILAERPEALVVANKVDLPAAWSNLEGGRPNHPVSAERGDGIGTLIHKMGRCLVAETIEPVAAVPFRAEQLTTIEAAIQHLQEGRDEEARALLAPHLRLAAGRTIW